MQDFGSEFFNPINQNIRDFANDLHSTKIGRTIRFSTDDDLHDKSNEKIILIGVSNNSQNSIFLDNLLNFRRDFYSLFNPNWDLFVYDLGDIILDGSCKQGLSDALKKIKSIPNTKIVLFCDEPKLLKDILYSSNNDEDIFWTHISKHLDFLSDSTKEQSCNLLKDCLFDENLNIMDFVLLGYQNYFVAQEELDLLRKLNFDFIRLGEITENIKIVEPELRNSNFVSINFDSVQFPYFNNQSNTVNGFNSREICAISRYCGFSDKLKILSIFAINNQKLAQKEESQLLSQFLWYFVEGTNQNWSECNFNNTDLFQVYNVLINNIQIKFYKNIKSGKWWIGTDDECKNKKNSIFLPCSEVDYIAACKGDIPKKWLRLLEK